MTTPITHFTHNDLDALGCMLNLRMGIPDVSIKTYHTNYRDLYEQVHNCIEYNKKYDIQWLIISDVSFAQDRDLLEELIASVPKTLYIDHHTYPENFFEELSMSVVHDVERCATKIMYDTFKNKDKSPTLDTITDTINTYDLWKTSEEGFMSSMNLNEFFWNHNNIDRLCDLITENDFKLPDFYLSDVKTINDDIVTSLQNYRNKGLIHSNGEISVVFVDKYFSHVVLEEFKKGMKYVVVANSYGIIRVRANGESNIPKPTRDKIKELIIGDANIGHENAYTYKIQSPTFELIMNEIKKVSNTIQHNLTQA